MARATTRPRGATGDVRLKFDQRLVLSQWMLGLFEVERFDQLADPLKDAALEGFDEDNVSRFHGVLKAHLWERQELSSDLLRAYDENIVRHWQAITANRGRDGQRLYPKYFQYLSMLFAEVYLDRYFRDRDRLLADLNAHVRQFNFGKAEADCVPEYEQEGLNKLAFWMATGSGKTLIMHVNIRQYRYYLELHGRGRELNRIILLTPNEGLSRQHLEEFHLSGMDAEMFSKEGRTLFAGQAVEIIDIHKLREDMGEKTVAVDAFEGNNLVLVDEGHRGASGAEVGHWMKMRGRLCEKGFSFEYSATFGQAMKASGNRRLEQEYARCILCDYSYKYFYKDGYGKDYHILNLEDDSQEDVRQLYLTACLLVFYQQLRLFQDQPAAFRPYLIERPLWVFVGGSVNAVRTQNRRQVSDVVDILLNLAEFVRDRGRSVQRIERLIRGQASLLDPHGHEIFANAFAYLIGQGLSAAAIFDDVLATVFNAPTQAALHVENLKGTDGEIALRLGENTPFGVINVGDAPSLCKLCEEHDELVAAERDFAESLFHGLSDIESDINLLIGSKKFTEGWNSWRVSTMGLMNVGRTEGSEIIQLFGRGVRLKGYEFCLKRTRRLEGMRAPKYIEALETLNIFGIRADYMRQFKEYLEDEGLPINEDRIEFVLPVLKHLGATPLRMVRLKDGIDFKRDGPKPALAAPPAALARYPVTVDWYPRIQSQRSLGIREPADVAVKHEGRLTRQHLAFMDTDAVYFELQRFKNERAWHNLNLSREAVGQLLAAPGWYRLFIPPEELAFDRFGRVQLWQEIAVALLKKYCDRYYKFRKNEYEMPHLEYRDLSPDDPNFFEEYRFLIEQSQEAIIETLGQVKAMIEAGTLRDVQVGNLHAIAFAQHLYEPLIYLNSDLVEVRPVPLNGGERDFVVDLRAFYDGNKRFFEGKELYLLRNLSRGKGIGFFEAGNFYPDFILWLLTAKRQYVTFVDPKGIRNLQGLDDPKIAFYRTIKELEQRLGDPKVVLNSFILSETPHQQVRWWNEEATEAEFAERHVLFKKDASAHIAAMLRETVRA